jgi:hypothetical protein
MTAAGPRPCTEPLFYRHHVSPTRWSQALPQTERRAAAQTCRPRFFSLLAAAVTAHSSGWMTGPPRMGRHNATIAPTQGQLGRAIGEPHAAKAPARSRACVPAFSCAMSTTPPSRGGEGGHTRLDRSDFALNLPRQFADFGNLPILPTYLILACCCIWHAPWPERWFAREGWRHKAIDSHVCLQALDTNDDLSTATRLMQVHLALGHSPSIVEMPVIPSISQLPSLAGGTHSPSGDWSLFRKNSTWLAWRY